MKALSKFLLVTLSALTLLAACSKDKNNGGPGYVDPFPPITPGGINSQIYSGWVSISDREFYRDYLRDAGICMDVLYDFCKQFDSNPNMELQFYGTEVNPYYGLPGKVVMKTFNGTLWSGNLPPYSTTFYYINNNTQLEAVTLGFPGTPSYNDELVITVTGKPGDPTVQATLEYRGQALGQVQLRKQTYYTPYYQ